ncbi:MAG: ABC transporter substrate-binding protein [Firmicutes bacterium]|nr:ABC transporter substrate-binding protein [Bacillota bacterium]
MKKRCIALLLALAMMFALSACTGNKPDPGTDPGTNPSPEAGEPAEGGEITVGLYNDLDASLDPHMSSSSAATREILFNIFEGLVKPDSDGNLVPAIAESYSVNSGADQYTFKLRAGVKFHNGKDVTADDVVWSLSRAAGLETGEPLVSDVANIAAVTKTDDSTIVIDLKKPDTEFLAHITTAIIPEGHDPLSEVIGTGPFKFVSRVVQDNIVLEKFGDYWGEPAHLDKVTLKIIENPEALVMALRSGSLDMAVRLDASQIPTLTNMNILEGSSNIVQALYLNNAVKPFDDVRVRQALCYAIDKHEVIDLASDGHGSAVGSSMFPAFGKYFMPELTDYYTKDIDKAKALLAEAGYPNGFEFTITVPSSMQSHVDVAQVIEQLLQPIGVTAKVDKVEWATWYSEAYQGRKFEATVIGMDAHGVAASDMLARFQSSSSKNFINFSNAEYDEAYTAAVSTTDDAEQTKLFKQCETILTEQAANVYIQDGASFTAMAKDLGGFEFYPLYVLDLSRIYRVK